MATYCLKHGVLVKHFCKLSQLPVSSATASGTSLGSAQTFGDLGPEDELVLFSTKKALSFRRKGLQCKVSLMVAEPAAIQQLLYKVLPLFRRRFYRILTHSRSLLSRCPNAEHWIHGGNWVAPEQARDQAKTALVSIIASKKRSTQGHRLRHDVITWARSNNIELDVFGRGYNPLENKVGGHAPYTYSVVIENCQSEGYFTEKLVDAFLCESIPIYWGDPDIAQHFDTGGMIICNSLKDIQIALKSIGSDAAKIEPETIIQNRDRAEACLSQANSMACLSEMFAPYNLSTST